MDEDFTDRERWCPHGFARISSGEGKGLSACPDCSNEHAENAHQGASKRHPGDQYVICEIREIP